MKEVVTSKRKNIVHLHKMNPVEFVLWLREDNGVLNRCKYTLKIDGLGARFGRDQNGWIFLEGSRSGPVFESGEFFNYANSNGASEDSIQRAKHYDDMLELLKNSSFMLAIPDDTKVFCEILYSPMATETDFGMKFVTVEYDKEKLGKIMTIVPLKVEKASSGHRHPMSSFILSDLYTKTNNNIRIVSPDLYRAFDIDLGKVISTIESITDAELNVIRSRKHADRESKKVLKTIIQNVQNDMSSFILTHPSIIGKKKLGPSIEGIIIDTGEKLIKVTSPEYKEARSKCHN